jgi:hypothetical protein
MRVIDTDKIGAPRRGDTCEIGTPRGGKVYAEMDLRSIFPLGYHLKSDADLMFIIATLFYYITLLETSVPSVTSDKAPWPCFYDGEYH